MHKQMNDWFEVIELASGERAWISKFANKSFGIPADYVEKQWMNWSPAEKARFADAFSVREALNKNDERIVSFMISHGDPSVWNSIALLAARHSDRQLALRFLTTRIETATTSASNYYQALSRLRPVECVAILESALRRHEEAVRRIPKIEAWADRLLYLDYLSCSATLFEITGKREYGLKVLECFQHPDVRVQELARMIVDSRGIEPHRL